jgi:hypothetical protein
MTGEEIATLAWDASEAFGKCGKFAGAATVEIVKQALADEGLSTSVRDVFIRGLPVEWDLIVPRPLAQPSLNGLIYEPADVACALEIKLSGLHGKEDAPRINYNFERAKALGVSCAYVTLGERQSYRHKASEENLSFSIFTITWHTSNTLTDTGDWVRLLTFLRGRISAVSSSTQILKTAK